MESQPNRSNSIQRVGQSHKVQPHSLIQRPPQFGREGGQGHDLVMPVAQKLRVGLIQDQGYGKAVVVLLHILKVTLRP